MCPAATRWCPTPEQLMILEEMYRSGTRTPNAAQIQQITARLAIYGRVEGKNVFYWFQNHKARDRQKLRKKLTKQLERQQLQLLYQPYCNNHYYHCFDRLYSASGSSVASPRFAYYNPSARFIPKDGAQEAPSKLMMTYGNNNACEMDTPGERMEILEKPIMGSTYSRDWMMMMMDVGLAPPCCNINPRPPVTTLELFPITSSNFKETKTPSN